MRLTRKLKSLGRAQKYAREHAPENYMRMQAEAQVPPELERFAAPKQLLEVRLPTLDEILLNQKAFGYRYFPK